MLSVIAWSVLLQPLSPDPVFLESNDLITVWMPTPMVPADLDRKLKVIMDGRSIPITEVVGHGKPARDPSIPVDPQRVVLAGSFQGRIGGSDWDPDGTTIMKKIGDERYELVLVLPPGNYEYKVARGGSWAENYGQDFARDGSNLSLRVPEGVSVVRVVVDFKARTIRDSVNHPQEVETPRSIPAMPMSGKRFYQAFRVRLAGPLKLTDLTKKLTLVTPSGGRRVIPREILSDPAFQYHKTDLGSRWSPQGTWFKVWSPWASKVEVAVDGTASAARPQVVPMTRGAKGVWYAYVKGNLHRRAYTYRFQFADLRTEGADINAFASTPDHRKSVVVNLDQTDPAGWPGKPTPTLKPTQSVIYELHVRDFTAFPLKGVDQKLRGTYLGLATQGAKTPKGNPAALDYLAWLGVTDIHILPVQSFQFGGYSWGYGTTLFNAPEESYAVRKNDPLGPIVEMKQMIQAMHNRGLRVVLDVVYNHTWPPDGPDSAFQAAVPSYYFRTDDRGAPLNESGVGNAMADERPMVRKYVRESLTYWQREYRVDGFRFDLLGMHTPESVRDWAKAMRAVDPDATLYGEPWTGGGALRFGKGDQKGTTVAVFNDRFRGAFRGDTRSPQPGFMHGNGGDQRGVLSALQGSLSALDPERGFTDRASETINYVSAHDDLTLWDKTALAMPGAKPAEQEWSVRLGLAATLLGQGIPFIEGGVELGRTKGGNPNSYDAGDAVNQYDWARADQFWSLAEWTKAVIGIRKRHPMFQLETPEQIRACVRHLPDPTPGLVVLHLDGKRAGDTWREALLILNGSAESVLYEPPTGEWNVAISGPEAKDGSLRKVLGKFRVPMRSPVLIWR